MFVVFASIMGHRSERCCVNHNYFTERKNNKFNNSKTELIEQRRYIRHIHINNTCQLFHNNTIKPSNVFFFSI